MSKDVAAATISTSVRLCEWRGLNGRTRSERQIMSKEAAKQYQMITPHPYCSAAVYRTDQPSAGIAFQSVLPALFTSLSGMVCSA